MFKRLMTALLLNIKTQMNIKQDSMRLTLTSIVYIMIMLQVFGAPSGKSKLCVLPTCKAKGDDILKTIDWSVDPCTDMYSFSCGKKLQDDIEARTPDRLLSVREWLTKVTKADVEKLLKEPGYKFRGKDSSAIKKVKDLYKTCMSNETSEGRKKLIEIINEFGSWSAGVGSNFKAWNEETWNFQKTLERINLYNGHVFFRFYPQYLYEEGRFIYALGQSTGVKFPELLQNASVVEDLLSASVRLVESMGGNTKIAQLKLKEVISFEQKILKIFDNDGTTRNYTTYEQLQAMLGDSIDIKSFMSSYLKGSVFSMKDTVHLLHSTYFSRLGQLIKNTSKETLCNYMMWVFTTNHIPSLYYMTSSSLNETLSEVTSLMYSGLMEINSRSEECSYYANIKLPLAAGALYVDRHVKAEVKNELTDMMNKMRDQFLLMLDSLDWMDNSTKTNLKAKVRALNLQIGYPDWLLDPVKLDNHYKSLKIDSKLILNSLHSMYEYDQAGHRTKYGRPNDRERWLEPPAIYSNIVDSEINTIFISATALTVPVYDLSVSKPERYGALGTMGGVAYSNLFGVNERIACKDVWNNATLNALEELYKCITGVNTTEEKESLLIYTGGLRITFNAYRAARLAEPRGLNLTNDKLFFLSYVQGQCESKQDAESQEEHGQTINQVLSYSEEFATAFNCKPDSPMYTINKCKIW